MNDIIKIISYLSFLLLVGLFLKNKVRLFQKLFLPSSVIGGIVGLILGKDLLGKTYDIVPLEWYKTISSIPGLLIVPIIVSIPLGMEINKSKSNLKNSINMGIILLQVTLFQLLLGYGINYSYRKFLRREVYSTFGAELNAGFAGGHGTAGVIGRTLNELGTMEGYWLTAQGVATTLATIGLVFGIISGIILINIGIRRRKITMLLETAEIPEKLLKGYEKEIEKQESIGRETMISTSIDTFGYHMALIFSVCGLSYMLIDYFKDKKFPIISSITPWSFGMILMLIIWLIMKKLKLDWSVDKKVKNKISGLLTEYAVVAAITSIPIVSMAQYMEVILVTGVLGLFLTWVLIEKMSKYFFKNENYYERAVTMYGTSTGVFITGLILLRICDPKLESPILGEYSLGFSLVALFGPILIVSSLTISMIDGPLQALIFLSGINLIFLIGVFIYKKIIK